MAPTMWIVAGPSCAGKSTLLSSSRAAALTGLPPDTQVTNPAGLYGRALDDDAYFHYQMLRPLKFALKKGSSPDTATYARDRKWSWALEVDAHRHCLLLVVDTATLLERVETKWLPDAASSTHRKKAEFWRAVYPQLDLDRAYDAFRTELAAHDVGWIEIDAARSDFPVLATA
jgi:hypothetical protein